MDTGPTDISRQTESLIGRCRRGDDAAFRELYLCYNKAMYNICRRMLNNQEDAEDVLQESFISAFRNLESYMGKASFGSWLKRIVINKCLDRLKQRNRQLVSLSENDIPDDDVLPEEPETYDTTEIMNAVMQLPDGYRVVLNLFLFEELSHRMIAKKLNISEGTSKSQYARARKKLIELIKKNRL